MKSAILISLSLLTVLFLRSCGEAEPIIYDGPLFISFTDGTSGKYLVDDKNTAYIIEVGIPLVQSSDITADLEVLTSTATPGEHFYLPGSVTIPSGELTTQFSLQGIYSELADRLDTIVILLSSNVLSNFDSTYTVYMKQMICNYDIQELAGEWNVLEVSAINGAYPPYVLTTAANPNGGDTIVVTDYWDYLQDYDASFNLVFDVSDTNNIKCQIPYQFQFSIPSEGDLFIESVRDGTFSKCYKTISDLELKISLRDGRIYDNTLLIMELQW